MSRIVLTRGAPGSGKTYFAKKWVQESSNRVRVERDEVRKFLGTVHGEQEELVTKIQREMVSTYLQQGKEVIISDTNARNKYITAWYEFGYLHDVPVEVVPMNTDLETTLMQNFNREVTEIVPTDVVERMFRLTQGKVPENPFVDIRPYTPGDVPVVTCDIDGTLAHMTGRNPFDGSLVHTDVVDYHVKSTLSILRGQGLPIILLTGRSDKYESETRDWLDQHLPAYDLYMRKDGDFRRDSVVKSEMVDNYLSDKFDVIMHFDDRNQVVSVLRKKGLKVAQVQEGDF